MRMLVKEHQYELDKILNIIQGHFFFYWSNFLNNIKKQLHGFFFQNKYEVQFLTDWVQRNLWNRCANCET